MLCFNRSEINIGRRAPCHETVTQWDNVSKAPRTLPADPHLTIFMGQDIEHCQVQGHIYVIADRGTPLAIAAPQDRKIVHDGYKAVSSELWTMGGNQRPRHKLLWGDASQRTKRRDVRNTPSDRTGSTSSRYPRWRSTTSERVRDLNGSWRARHTQGDSQTSASSVTDVDQVSIPKI